MPVVGLDLGSHNFRAVEIDESKGKLILRRFGSYENPKINLKIDSDNDLSNYAHAVKDFYRNTGFSTPEVISAIPESEVFTRVIKLPEMSEKELKSSIQYEAEQYIPLPLKDVSFDFQILDSDVTEKDKMNVLLVAAKRNVLERYVNLLKMSGLRPKSLEPETLAMGRILGDSVNRPSASLIVNIGYENTQIIISYKGFVRFTRSSNFGGETLTRAVAQSLGFEHGQAEEYKKTYGLEQNQADGKVFMALKPVVDNIISEIRRSKVFYTTHNPNVMINRAILSGGTALMPGLLFYVANNLDLEVELANPWRNILLAKDLEGQKNYLMENGPQYVTAVGLALRGLR